MSAVTDKPGEAGESSEGWRLIPHPERSTPNIFERIEDGIAWLWRRLRKNH